MKYRIDFFKTFNLVPPVCGLVNKVTSPKGVRRIEDDGYTHYELHSDLISTYKGEALALESGLYHVVDIGSVQGRLNWNHYLFILDTEGYAYPIAEYLDQPNSSWIAQAIKLVKRYFQDDPAEMQDPIQLTSIDYELPKRTPQKSRWTKIKK